MAGITLGATMRKLVAMIALPPVIYMLGGALSLSPAECGLAVLGFWIGMLFPDLDVFTGWIKTSFQTMLLILFLGAGIMVYPFAWNSLGGFCPTAQIQSFSSLLEAQTVCQLGLSLMLVGAAYIIAWLLVGWIPEKNSFHQWTTMALIAGGMGMLNRAISISSNPWPLTIGFGAGYAMHIIIDQTRKFGAGELAPLSKNASLLDKISRL